MKKINIQCYDNGRATLKTKDIHIESENMASIIEVDFSQTEYKNYQKGVDIQSGSYLLRYLLGNDEVVFKELTYENTLPGELVITPFVFDEVNDRKVRYLTDNSVIIHKRRSIASQDVPDNADLILEEIKEFLKDTTDKLVVDIEFNKDTNLLSLILEDGDEISTIIDLDVSTNDFSNFYKSKLDEMIAFMGFIYIDGGMFITTPTISVNGGNFVGFEPQGIIEGGNFIWVI